VDQTLTQHLIFCEKCSYPKNWHFHSFEGNDFAVVISLGEYMKFASSKTGRIELTENHFWKRFHMLTTRDAVPSTMFFM
jgi:hypothetical protein